VDALNFCSVDTMHCAKNSSFLLLLEEKFYVVVCCMMMIGENVALNFIYCLLLGGVL
jgi:hypothetical protein